MSPVYMFADFGEGPTVVARHRPQAALWDAYTKGARRWWLVQCDNAAAGRAGIAEAEKVGAACAWDFYATLGNRMVTGRIIESGVKP